MIVPLAQFAQAATLPGLMLYTLIRAGLLFAVVWFTLRWSSGDFLVVVLWVAGAAVAGALAASLLAPVVHASLFGTALIQAGAELAVLLVMLNRQHMGSNSALSLVPTFIVVIGLADYFLFR